MYKSILFSTVLLLALAACGKSEKAEQEAQLKHQAEKARMELQQKADDLARNPPPELLKAAQEAAAKAANSPPASK